MFHAPRRTAPWLGVAAVCMVTSLSVGATLSDPTATRPANPSVAVGLLPASAQPGAGRTSDSGSLSVPNPLPNASPTTAPVDVPSLTATVTAAIAPRRTSITAPKVSHPSGCCATGGAAASAGLFEDLQYLTGSALSARLDQYVAIGAKVARFQLIWENVQSSGPGTYDWQYIDAVVAGLEARGITALPVIDTTPTWARAAGCSAHVCAPADPNTYAAFAAAAARRYAPQGVHDWEIWNEPNNPIFWQPSPNTAAYTELLKAAYASIHAVDPAATVISGGLAPAATGNGWIAPVQFLSEIYADGGGGSFDAVGWHPYDFPDTVTQYRSDGHAWDQMTGTSPSARSLMIAHGDGGKSIWATEFGAPTCTGDSTCVTEGQQATMVTEAYALWRTYSWAGPLISYMYQDTGTDQANREDFFGFVRADGSQKPAYAAFRAAALA
jgi:hypothetical protein